MLKLRCGEKWRCELMKAGLVTDDVMREPLRALKTEAADCFVKIAFVPVLAQFIGIVCNATLKTIAVVGIGSKYVR